MPYYLCPACALPAYSAAGESRCPACDAPLRRNNQVHPAIPPAGGRARPEPATPFRGGVSGASVP
jgi:uncharacterized Zn finger protein (UPF0148 family)